MNSVKSRLKELDNGKKAGVDKASEFKHKKKKGGTGNTDYGWLKQWL